MGFDPAENDLVQLAEEWFKAQSHPLSPEVEAILDEIDARKKAEALTVKEQARPAGTIFVCSGKVAVGCGYVFKEGKPETCPRCGKSYVRDVVEEVTSKETSTTSLTSVLSAKLPEVE
jgi:predicted Zn-ribbon and HTH transcriptional regulator